MIRGTAKQKLESISEFSEREFSTGQQPATLLEKTNLPKQFLLK